MAVKSATYRQELEVTMIIKSGLKTNPDAAAAAGASDATQARVVVKAWAAKEAARSVSISR